MRVLSQRCLATAALLLLLAGCYTYRPVALETLSPGASLRARLDAQGEREVLDQTGSAAGRVDGRLVRGDADSLVMEVWRTDLVAARAFQPGLLRIALGRNHVREVMEKRFSYVRTGVTAAIAAAGAFQLFRLLWNGAGGSGDGPDPGGPQLDRCCR